MHVHLNERMIARRAKIGRYASFIGLAVLLIGMIITFRGPQYLWVSFGCLMIGLIASQVGTYHLRRWGRSPRPDEVLTRSLKGLDRRYHFYGWLLPADYVLLGPAGLFVFVTRDQTGEVEYRHGRWRQPFKWTRLLTIFAQEGLGDPAQEAEAQAARLERFLAERLSDEEAAAVSVQGVVTFLMPGVRLELEDEPDVPVMPVKKLKEYIRSRGKGEKLPAELRERVVRLFEERES